MSISFYKMKFLFRCLRSRLGAFVPQHTASLHPVSNFFVTFFLNAKSPQSSVNVESTQFSLPAAANSTLLLSSLLVNLFYFLFSCHCLLASLLIHVLFSIVVVVVFFYFLFHVFFLCQPGICILITAKHNGTFRIFRALPSSGTCVYETCTHLCSPKQVQCFTFLFFVLIFLQLLFSAHLRVCSCGVKLRLLKGFKLL